VRDFFEQHRNFADLYIKSYFEDVDNPNLAQAFPEEMLAYVWLNSDYSSASVYNLVDLEKDEY